MTQVSTFEQKQAVFRELTLVILTSLLVLGEDGSSNKGSSISLRAQDSLLSKAPSSAQSETSLADGETEQDAAEATDRNQSEEAPTTPSPPLSPVTSDISEPQSTLVNQTQEATWRDVINICVSGVSGGE